MPIPSGATAAMDSPPYDPPSEQTPQLPLRHHFPADAPVMSEMLRRGQSQLDEGFSEETRSQSDSEMMFSALEASDETVAAQKVLQSLLALPADQREFIIAEGVNLLDSMAKARIQRQITNLTHFDPAHYLPNEVFLQIFSYLSPSDLLSASTISRDWRIRSQDEKLWRGCFAREGWVLDRARIEAFEQNAQKKGEELVEHLAGGSIPPLERRSSRKRKTEEAFSGDEGPTGKARAEASHGPTSVPAFDGAGEDSSRISADEASDDMEGVEGVAVARSAEDSPSSPSSLTPASSSHSGIDTVIPPSPADFTLQPTLLQPGRGQAKLSWPYLYKQRRRLEANWEKGFYTMFQLPHRDHPSEGHLECVYTIQHTNRHLVSGSRDKTIRIWDLNTNRLKGKPLRGHDASVLCLQFDERPEHDIIVSGGSDAYVIIWRFSTGEIIKKMDRAHDESVLNLRFDDRYIVTCSKDKTIKVWNRYALERNSPLIPEHAIHNFDDPADSANLIAEYSLLTWFNGHHAAVNAVMIHDNTIVSASGDRTIKAWDLHSGQHKKSYNGHQKGIACVQFDGRRIVSGSSDNTVRIFDAEQQAEIACLAGHGNLVRTVQARFGDLDTTTDEELQDQAREADRRFYAALQKGMRPATASRRAPRNAGSSRPEDMQSVGTKIPPGGGGSRWAKIVSGSYDETVIVWKRDSEGKWQVKLRLHQDQLLRANRAHRQRGHFAAAAHAAGNNANGQPAQAGPANPQSQVLTTAQSHLQQVHQLVAHQQHLNGSAAAQPHHLPAFASAQSDMNNVNNDLQQLHQINQAQRQANQQQQTTVTTTTAGPTTTVTAHAPAMANNPNPPTVTNIPAQYPPGHPVPTVAQQFHIHHQLAPLPGGGVPVQHFPAVNPIPPAAQAANPNQPAQGGQQALQAQAPAARTPSESNRVFKLQFDARRIVCCSQNRTIVGWDFANGDAELERVGEWSLETA